MPLYHSILETLQLGATYRSSQSSPLRLLGKKICRFQVPLHQPPGMHICHTQCNFGDDELCFMKLEGPYICTKMPFSQSCIHQLAQVAIHVLHDDRTSPIWYCITTSWAMKGWQLTLLHCCGWLSDVLYFSSRGYGHPNKTIFWTLARCLSLYDPLESAALVQLANSQAFSDPTMLNNWLHCCYTDCSFPQPCMPDMNVFRNWHSSGFILWREEWSFCSCNLSEIRVSSLPWSFSPARFPLWYHHLILTWHILVTSHCKIVGVSLLQWCPRKLNTSTRMIEGLGCKMIEVVLSCLLRWMPHYSILQASESLGDQQSSLPDTDQNFGALEISVRVSLWVYVNHALCRLNQKQIYIFIYIYIWFIIIFALSWTPRWKHGNNLRVGEVLHAIYEGKKSSLLGYIY